MKLDPTIPPVKSNFASHGHGLFLAAFSIGTLLWSASAVAYGEETFVEAQDYFNGCEITAPTSKSHAEVHGTCLGHNFSNSAEGLPPRPRDPICYVTLVASRYWIVHNCHLDGNPALTITFHRATKHLREITWIKQIDTAGRVLTRQEVFERDEQIDAAPARTTPPKVVHQIYGGAILPGSGAESEALAIAHRAWSERWKQCGNHFLSSRTVSEMNDPGGLGNPRQFVFAGDIQIEVTSPQILVYPKALTAADRLNGLLWVGDIEFVSNAYRIQNLNSRWKNNIGWTRWMNVDPDPPTQYALSLTLANRSNQWSISNVKSNIDFFPDLFRVPAPSDYGWYPSFEQLDGSQKPAPCELAGP
jgi:hypothetical protein